MGLTVNTNLAALNTQRNISGTQDKLNTAIQRLSSGLRINSAKDDAAGLAISERFSVAIRGLEQARRNANDGISLAQTAESALGQLTSNLQRIRELAVQSANGTNTSIDRTALNNEAAQLLAEIDRVAVSTDFNGTKLLDGTFTGKAFQIGGNAGETISVNMSSAKTSVLGSGDSAAVQSVGTTTGAALSVGDVVINGVTIGATSNALDTASNANKSYSAIAKAAAINAKSAETGVTATVATNVHAGTSMTGAATSGTVTLNGVAIAGVSTTTDLVATRAAVAAAINNYTGQTGVIAVDTGNDKAGIELKAADGRNITVSLGGTLTAAATGLTAASTYGGYTLTSSKEIVISRGSGTLSNSGLSAGTYATQTAFAANTSNNGTAFASGDFKLNGVLIGATLSTMDNASNAGKTASAIAKVAAINALTSQSGVTARVNANDVLGAAMTPAATSGALVINGVTTSVITTTTSGADSRAVVLSAVNAVSAQTGVVAVDTGADSTGIRLVAADGRNIDIASGAGSTLTAASTGLTGTGVGGSATKYGTFTLSSATEFSVAVGTVAAGVDNLGIVVGTYGAGRSGQALNTVNISSVDGANKALAAIDNALSTVNSARSGLGAYQNRFESVVANLMTASENLTAAKSRIIDTDFAAETSMLTKMSIIQQAGIAMLAQANSVPQQVLSLLK